MLPHRPLQAEREKARKQQEEQDAMEARVKEMEKREAIIREKMEEKKRQMAEESERRAAAQRARVAAAREREEVLQ